MNINQWRTGLKGWLQAKLLVDTWELRNPTEYGTLNGFIPPVQKIRFTDTDPGQVSALSDFYLTTRYRADSKYADLPLGNMEQLHATISRRLSLEYASIAPLLEFEMLAVDDPVQVMEYGDRQADWLVTLSFTAALVWIPDITPLPGDVPGNTIVYNLKADLYTEHLTDKLPDRSKWDKVGKIR